MVMNHSPLPGSPHFDFSSSFQANNGASLAPHSLQQKCLLCPFSPNLHLPNSKFDDFHAFTGEFHSRFACDESSDDSPRSEGSPGVGFGSTPNSENGQEARRKSGVTRGGGERGINKSGHSMYKGVRKRKGDRWVSEIREPRKKTRIWLGTFSTPEMAARAYDVAAFNLKTSIAYLNFPDYVSTLPIPLSCSPKHIQTAAAIAALRVVESNGHMGRTGGLVATPTPHVDEYSTSSSTEQQMESANMETKASWLMDEEMIFDMPNVLADMVEGLMITPPLHYLPRATIACHRNECSLWSL